jgi:hypothetical protein
MIDELTEYLFEILTLFHTVISKYLAKDPTNINLLNVSSNIFSCDKHFHKKALLEHGHYSRKNNLKIYDFDIDRSTF